MGQGYPECGHRHTYDDPRNARPLPQEAVECVRSTLSRGRFMEDRTRGQSRERHFLLLLALLLLKRIGPLGQAHRGIHVEEQRNLFLELVLQGGDIHLVDSSFVLPVVAGNGGRRSARGLLGNQLNLGGDEVTKVAAIRSVELVFQSFSPRPEDHNKGP